MTEIFFTKKPPGYKPPPPVQPAPPPKKKRVSVVLTTDEDKLEAIQKFYGGTATEALTKFIESQLCRQATVDKLEVKRFVKK